MDEQFKKSFLKGSAAASIGTVGAMVCQFISIIMLTRFVTKDDFGIYILILAYVGPEAETTVAGAVLTLLIVVFILYGSAFIIRNYYKKKKQW